MGVRDQVDRSRAPNVNTEFFAGVAVGGVGGVCRTGIGGGGYEERRGGAGRLMALGQLVEEKLLACLDEGGERNL